MLIEGHSHRPTASQIDVHVFCAALINQFDLHIISTAPTEKQCIRRPCKKECNGVKGHRQRHTDAKQINAQSRRATKDATSGKLREICGIANS
jgi:hypothetical protein